MTALLVLMPCIVARRCVFLHGVGETLVSAPTTDDTTGYWGGTENIAKYTPYCTTREFVHQDTFSQGWDSEALQSAYCAAAVGATGGSDIVDTVVLSHSMGNIVIAAALASDRCRLGANASWFSASAPWQGSKAIPWLVKICDGTAPISNPVVKWLADKMTFCVQHTNHTSKAYLSLDPGYKGLKDVAKHAEKFLSGAMCGASPWGLSSEYSAGLEALSYEVGYGEDNDGMVGISSCKLPSKNYTRNYTSLWYEAAINHADGTCRDGDGDWGYQDRQPCNWLATNLG